MSDGPSHFATTDGGVTGLHDVDGRTALVAPSLDTKFNTLRAAILPFACWKVDNLRFAFDSSAVQPGLRDDLANLLDLIRRTTRPASAPDPARPPVLSIFGHADPTGDENYNKALSGRRARSIYGLLTRKVEIWENLADDAEGTNDRWGRPVSELMQEALGRTGKAPTAGAERHQLFRDYMDFLCHSDNPPGDLLVDPENFLGAGGDSRGKADFQGCSEFNPVLLLSQKEESSLSREARNERYAPNRRVTVLLFRPGTKIDVNKWPCPRTKETSAACKKRFFVDHAERLRRDPERARRLEDGDETFACRFYDRMTTRSPCEIPLPPSEGNGFLAVRIFFHARPMQGLQVGFFELAGGKAGDSLGDPVTTDENGLAVFSRTVRIGNYVCEVEYQATKVVCTVFNTDNPEILVLPIGRPYLSIDGDVEFASDEKSE